MNAYAEDTELVRQLVAYAGTSPAAVAKKAGVAVTTVNRPFNGTATNRLGRAALEKLQTAFPEFPGWRSATVADRRITFRHQVPEHDPDLVEIDSIDLAYGMGGTFVDYERGALEITKVEFSRTWLRKFTQAPPKLLFMTTGSGDSMEPTIRDQDIVIVDRSADFTRTMGDRIWAIVYGGVGQIKRLRPMPDGTVKIFSDNPTHPPEIATDGDLQVVGRVVASVRRH